MYICTFIFTYSYWKYFSTYVSTGYLFSEDAQKFCKYVPQGKIFCSQLFEDDKNN